MGLIHRRFQVTSVDLALAHRLYDESTTSPVGLWSYDHPALEALDQHVLPRYRVFMTRLEWREGPPDPREVPSTSDASCDPRERRIVERSTPLLEGFIVDASSVRQITCLGVGRFPHNALRPYVGEDPKAYYDDPERFDPGCLCGQISRDHGLVFVDGTGQVKFRDFGTEKTGGRDGSKNGTWIDGRQPVRDVVIDWVPGTYLGLGGRVWVHRDGQLVKEHVFKLRYERLDAS